MHSPQLEHLVRWTHATRRQTLQSALAKLSQQRAAKSATAAIAKLQCLKVRGQF